MTVEDARDRYSDYLDNTLDEETRAELQAFLARNPHYAAELIDFERTLALLHRLPPREPVLDMWQEFAPKVEEYRAERKLDLAPRLRQNWLSLLSQVSAGVILWTSALAARTQARLERYLLHDSLSQFHTE